MKKTISLIEIPYLAHVPTDGRRVPLITYYDVDTQLFSTFLPDHGKSNEIMVLPINEAIETVYLAKSPARETDCHLPFYETILQHFCFSDVWPLLRITQQDLINAIVSLHKYFVLLEYSANHRNTTGAMMMRTEIEYIFANHRAFYDCLHKIARTLHKKYKPKFPTLPLSFTEVVKKSDFATKYLLPQPLVDFYNKRTNVFLKMKDVRDNIIHWGHTMELLFECSDGFAVSIDDNLIKTIGAIKLWPERLLKPNRLGSVLAIIEFLTRDMYEAMQDLGRACMESFIPNPPTTIAEEYKLFFRSPVSKHLVSLDEYREKHWFDPKEVLGIT